MRTRCSPRQDKVKSSQTRRITKNVQHDAFSTPTWRCSVSSFEFRPSAFVRYTFSTRRYQLAAGSLIYSSRHLLFPDPRIRRGHSRAAPRASATYSIPPEHYSTTTLSAKSELPSHRRRCSKGVRRFSLASSVKSPERPPRVRAARCQRMSTLDRSTSSKNVHT
jgi:hypothetical protein